jgi:hypothetical protein
MEFGWVPQARHRSPTGSTSRYFAPAAISSFSGLLKSMVPPRNVGAVIDSGCSRMTDASGDDHAKSAWSPRVDSLIATWPGSVMIRG